MTGWAKFLDYCASLQALAHHGEEHQIAVEQTIVWRSGNVQ